MKRLNTFPAGLSQNKHLPIRIVSPEFGHLPVGERLRPAPFERLSYYFFLFVLKGSAVVSVDGADIAVGDNETIFLLPHQIRDISHPLHAEAYFKLGFDEECLSQLPNSYSFLNDQRNGQKIKFTTAAAERLKITLNIIQELLTEPGTAPALIVAHLHCLMTEMETAYLANEKGALKDQHSRFANFKVFVDDHLTEQRSVQNIADELAISTGTLNHLVKQHSGLSPKQFINERLILEAKRRLRYGDRISVKELAFELGFNDPDYFCRVFKKLTGQTVVQFINMS